MQRRRALQICAAVATLPLAGCSSTPEPPPRAPLDPAASATAGNASVASATPAGPPDPTSSTSDAPPAATAESPAQPPPQSAFSRVIGKVGRNHGHVLEVSFADVKAGVEKSYDLAGSAGHPHTVTLSPADMKALLAGQIFRAKSTRDKQHAHRVLVRCAPDSDPPEWITVCAATFSGQDEHDLVVPAADMSAGVERTYDVQGIAGHAHELKLSASDFQKLAKGDAVSILTSRDPDDAHLHVVFIQYRPHPKT